MTLPIIEVITKVLVPNAETEVFVGTELLADVYSKEVLQHVTAVGDLKPRRDCIKKATELPDVREAGFSD